MTIVEATITQILHEKRGNGAKYIRVMFSVGGKKQWAKTDLVPTFRNYARWKPMLEVGMTLGNLRLVNPKTIDADSWPKLLGYKRPMPDPPDPQGTLL